MFSFFKKSGQQIQHEEPSFEIELTAAVLAYEIARIDGDISSDELKILMEEIKIIANKVGKEESEILKIIEIYSNDSVSFYEFVEDINKGYTKSEKLSLLEFMWKIAYADGNLDVDEERLIRRLADMIKIKDMEVLKLKNISKS
ncbi:TerB family tellurite resistance protein [Gammaproteobacteria bacterium]|nr:TerB family tellurite resistance protein [Gammaproteobacteria bacterium]